MRHSLFGGRRLFRAAIGLALLNLLCAGPLFAGLNEWTSTGPWVGGGASALVVDPTSPQVLYAASGPNVFRSADSGATWQFAGAGIIADSVLSLAVDPSTPSTVFAGTDWGVFRSQDSGQTWTAVDFAEYETVTGFAIEGPRVYAAVGYGGPSPGGIEMGELSQSSDGGSTWQSKPVGPYYDAVIALAIVPNSASTVYAATAGGLFRSDDAGGSWTILEVPEGPDGALVNMLAIDPTSSLVYAGTAGALFESGDRGETWSEIGSSLPDSIQAFVVIPGSPSLVVASTASGFFSSVDQGAHWSAAGGAVSGSIAALVPSNGATPGLHVATDQGVWNLDVQTSMLTKIPSPFATAQVNALIAPAGVLFAGTSAGLFKSFDRGNNWIDLSLRLGGRPVQALAASVPPGCPALCPLSEVYAGTPSGLFRSVDGGGDWEALYHVDARSIALDPADASVLYVASATFIAKSPDGGLTWKILNVPVGMSAPPISVLVDSDAVSTVYVATPGSLFKSTDAGATWGALSAPFQPTSLTIAAGVLYSGTQSGIYASRDAGISWSPANEGLSSLVGGPPSVYAVAANPGAPSTVYAGCAFDGIFLSDSAGSMWFAIDAGLPFSPYGGYPPIDALLADPTDFSTVFAGTSLGIYAITSGRLPIENPPSVHPRHTIVRPF